MSAAASRPTRKSLSSAAVPSSITPAASLLSASLSSAPSASTSAAAAAATKGKGKRAASFAPGDHAARAIATFGRAEPAGAGKEPLSPRKVARRALVPRKSILKTTHPDDVTQNFTTGQIGLRRAGFAAAADDDDDDDDESEDEEEFRRLPGESTTRMLDRRVSFAAHAHVRMFDVIEPNRNALSQSTSSVGSTSSAGTASNPASPATPKVNIFAAAPSPGAAPEASRRRSSAASFASEGSADMSLDEASDDGLEGDEMDFTTAAGGIAAPSGPTAPGTPYSPGASTVSTHSDEDEDDDLAPRDDEDRTMDFTVATGGIIPPAAPPNADANVRRSLGYGVEEEEARRLNNWFAHQQQQQAPAHAAHKSSREQAAARAAAEELEGWTGEEEDDEDMDFTKVGGRIISAAEVDRSTEEVEMDLDDDAVLDEDDGMDYTTAAGGIFGAPRPSLTVGGGGEDETEELDDDDDGGMDFTVAGGGIAPSTAQPQHAGEGEEDETAGLDFTAAGGGIFGGRTSLSAPPQRTSLPRSPVKSPRKSATAPTPTRPIASSLSRPTASSAAKAKPFAPASSASGSAGGGRNLFESPAKQLSSSVRSRASLAASPGRKRTADEADPASAVFGRSPAKRRASEAAPRTAGGEDFFGQSVFEVGSTSTRPAPPVGTQDVLSVDDLDLAPLPPAPPLPQPAPTHSIFSPVKSAISSIFSPARNSPKPAPAAAAAVAADEAGSKQSLPVSLFSSPVARAPVPPTPSAAAEEDGSAPQATEVNIFSTSPQAAPPTVLSASFSSANVLEAPVDDSPDDAAAMDVVEDDEQVALFEEEVRVERDPSPLPQPPPSRTREETATPSKKRLGRPSLASGALSQPTTDAGENADEVFQPQPVSLGQFLDMTGLNFMTNITAGRRRSTIQPGELLGLHRKATDGQSTGRSGGDYRLIDYANHVLNMQDYVVYHWACNNLREATEKSRHIVQVLDEEASLANPLLFTEYLEADDDEKRMIETQLKHLKTYAQHTVKKRWLEWRLDILAPLREGHENDRRDMLEDRERLVEVRKAFDKETDLVALRAKHAALRLQLAQEKQKVEDVQACDQEELAHRRSDIQEQKDQIDGVKSEMHDVNVVLASLQAKKEAIVAQKKTYLDAIAFGKSASAGSFTAERLSELEDDVRTLEYLHSIRLIERTPSSLALEILSDLKLTLACDDGTPTAAGATVELVGVKMTKRNVELAEKLFVLVKQAVEEDKSSSVPQLVQKVHQLWLAALRLTHELHLIRLRYPVAYTTPLPGVVRAEAAVMVCPIRAKLNVAFALTRETLLGWPESTGAVGVEVEVKYSRAEVKADPKVLKDIIVARLAEPDRRAGALVDGCLDAVGRYC